MSLEKPHILILSKWYPNPSDPQLGIFVQNQAQLISQQFDVSVIYIHSIPNSAERYLVKSIKNSGVNEIRVYYKQSQFFKKLQHFFKYRKAQKIGLGQLAKPVDLVHVHVPVRPAILALHLLKRKQTPFLITEHWSGHLNGQFEGKPFFYKAFYKNILKKACTVTVVSQVLLEKIAPLLKKDPIVIPNVILASPKKEAKKTKDFTQIISVSDLNNKTKNITGLLMGFQKALLLNSKLKLTIIGDGPDKKLVVEKIRQLSLENNVVLMGRKTQTEVLSLLPKFHFYICNSNVETFGMTVAEALASGLPVICTRCGGPEAFVNKQNGILIPIKDEPSLTSAIIEMNSNFQSYEHKQIRKRINDKFGKAVILDKWKKTYHSILSE